MRVNGVIYVVLMLVIIFTSVDEISGRKNDMERLEVAKVIAMEGCSEGKLGMWLIGNTIHNRVKERNKTPYEVVTEPNQYFGYTHKNKNLRYQECKDEANMIVKKMYNYTLEDFTDGAIFYLRPDEYKRAWHQIKTITYKQHTFYKEK